ncbi:MAG TPA: DUF6516 family protein [Gammaproteobacteria bacterium]|jgi:hypothetical protein
MLLRDRYVYADGAVREMVIWQLPVQEAKRLHGIKYRLFYGYPGKPLIRYDNEQGKGDHRHYDKAEEPYVFLSVERLIADFRTDIARLRGEKHE